MAWTDILDSQVDADSPLNDLLYGAIKGNLDYLHSVAGQIAVYAGADANAANTDPLTIVVCPVVTRDWRDRLLVVAFGLVNSGINSGVPVAYVYGGVKDGALHSQRASHKPADIVGWNGSALFKAEAMYTANGSANYTTEPYLIATSKESTGLTEAYLWVDASGNLKLTLDFNAGAGYKGYAYQVILMFSEDLGGH